MEFFIINYAVFSKLCILGDDVEPCFEGSSVTAPKVSASFTKIDDKFYLVLDTEEINLITPTKVGTIVYSNLYWDILDFPVNKKTSC